MRIIFTAIGQPGHSFPLVPLAKELADAGHEITFATSAQVAPQISAAGLRVAEVGIDVGPAFGEAIARGQGAVDASSPEFELRAGGAAFGDVMPRAFAADLGRLIERERPDLIVAEMACLGGQVAASLAGVPCVIHTFGRRFDVGSPLHTAIFTPFASVLEDMGLPAVSGPGPLGHAYLDVCPPSLQISVLDAPQASVPLQTTAWNPPVSTRPSRPKSGRPWVYLTLGTVSQNAAVLRTAIDGLTRLDVDILLATGAISPAEFTDLPDSVRVEAFVPQAELLRDFSLVVHHGGSGTTMGAAQHGLVQLMLPQGADQFGNAEAVSAFGAGQSLIGPDVTADSVEQAARTLLTSTAVHDAAQGLAQEIAVMPSVKAVAGDIASWSVPSRP